MIEGVQGLVTAKLQLTGLHRSGMRENDHRRICTAQDRRHGVADPQQNRRAPSQAEQERSMVAQAVVGIQLTGKKVPT
mgnify:CR=1 FL=1